MTEDSGIADGRETKPLTFRLIIAAVIVAVASWIYFTYRDSLSLQAMAEQEQQLREWQQRYPVQVMAIAFMAYVIVTGLSLPFAGILSLTYAWYFGFWKAVVLISFASTTGASLAFLLSRYLLRDVIQNRLGDQLQKFHRALEKEGAFYLFTLRLIPAVPFVVINLVMGLTNMRLRTFWWVSQLGMLPGTLAYVYAGSSVPSLRILAQQGARGILTPRLMIAFAVLGLFPLAARRVLQYLRPEAASAINSETQPTPDSEPQGG